MEKTTAGFIRRRSDKERYKPFEIVDLSLFPTSICNSGCLTCDIWKNKHRVEFPFEQVERLADSQLLKDVTWVLLGGEYTIYSHYLDLVKLLTRKDIPFIVVTNGILPKKIYALYDAAPIPNLSISVDGIGDRHDLIRGHKGNFQSICEIITWVKANHPETSLRIGYTVSVMNTLNDLSDVRKFAQLMGLDLKINFGQAAMLYGSINALATPTEFYDVEQFFPDDKVVQLYRPWVRGWKPVCQGITHHPVLLQNGDLVLCQYLGTVLGNVFETPFDDLWQSEKVRSTILDYARKCNACWMVCNRKYDAEKYSLDQIHDIREIYGC